MVRRKYSRRAIDAYNDQRHREAMEARPQRLFAFALCYGILIGAAGILLAQKLMARPPEFSC